MADTKPRTIKVHLTSEPFMDDPDGAEAYYTALGRALILWGRLESHLDALLLTLSNLKPSEPFRPKEMPVSMKRKTSLLRTLLRNVPDLEPFRKPILDMLPQVMDSAQDRHVIVHGHWNGFVSSNTVTGRFIVHKHKGQKLIVARYDVDLETLQEMAAAFDDLNTKLLPISWNASVLSNTLGPQPSPSPRASRKARRSPAKQKPAR